ncbi:unnamed protein product [Didymodactylos carnosus]|uniref:Uncharacterized protein n=1 Tax=Didymodactylos carnosus TaxID=1234261 RepID=A0A813X6Z4_9BILA|nr:unnamed protein product [Didymodactylos carnosus]CAF3658864.1 unnamed protein product [Didymodactylos carnosus]
MLKDVSHSGGWFLTLDSGKLRNEPIVLGELRYNVPLDETTNSSLKWDYDQYNSEVLLFEWNITREYDSGALLAFTNYEYTNNADLLVLDESDQLHNAYTNDDSMIILDNDKKIDAEVISGETKQKTIQNSGTVNIRSGKLNRTQLYEIKKNRSSLQLDPKNIKLHLQRVQLLKSQRKVIPSFPQIRPPDGQNEPYLDLLNSFYLSE